MVSENDGLGVVVVVGQCVEGGDGVEQPHPQQGRHGATSQFVVSVLAVVERPLSVEDCVVVFEIKVF